VLRKGCSGQWRGSRWGLRVVEMKILSYNVRGLGGFEKRAEVRRFIQDKQPFVVCLQQSKLTLVDEFIVKSIWDVLVVGILIKLPLGLLAV